MSPEFHLGYRPELEGPAKAAWQREGAPPIFSASYFGDAPLPQAFTLADLILWWFDQGNVGSCACNGGISIIALAIAHAAKMGSPLKEAQLSRAWLWYHARRLDGLLGRGTDGASITNTLRAANLVGVATEEAWPYRPEHNWLERAPSSAAVASAKAFGLKGLVDLRFGDPEGIRRSIVNGCPPEIGIWWPYGWDRGQIDRYGRTVGIGNGTFGHALGVIGYVEPGVWDQHRWYHILNSHGAIYPLPTPEMRAVVRGYASARPDRCYAFWCREDLLRTVAGYGNAEIVAPVGPYAPDDRRPASWDTAGS